ncbi:MAG: hypothetical protein AAF915_11900 [Cyanobacteria bacterium P01_D01_bin.50]
MEEELKNLVAKTLPNPKTFRFNNNALTCYIHDLHLAIKAIDGRFQFSLTRCNLETLTSDLLYSASAFNSLSELEEGLRAMGFEMKRRGFIEILSNQDSSAPEVESILDLVETQTLESSILERTRESSESSKPPPLQKTRKESLKQALIPAFMILAVNLPFSFIFSRIWVQTMLHDVAEEMARELIQQKKDN